MESSSNHAANPHLQAAKAAHLQVTPVPSCERSEVPRLRGERDEARAQAARLAASRDDLARQQGRWKAAIARVGPWPAESEITPSSCTQTDSCPLNRQQVPFEATIAWVGPEIRDVLAG